MYGGQDHLAAVVDANVFDSAVSADTGDLWAQAVDPSASYSPLTLAPGQVISGTLVSVDDFFVTLIDAAGDRRTIERPIGSDMPKVEINDPLEAHRQQMLKYTDEIMHNLVAYLVTLK